MVRPGNLIAVVGASLIWCAALLVVGCAGVRSGAPQEEQGHTEASKEQGRSPEATASEEARCGGTRTFKQWSMVFTTNDVPGCPKGGLLSGTDGPDKLFGGEGEDEIRGLGDRDFISGGAGSDVIYGGPGYDGLLGGGEGEDVIYGGPGDDDIHTGYGERDKLYCGEGRDEYLAGKRDYVSSSCEEKMRPGPL